MSAYIAHIDDEGREQPLLEHLQNVGDLAREFAAGFAPEIAREIGKAHDLGKYSEDFQRRIRGVNISVDHSTAGGQYFLKRKNLSKVDVLAAFCVMGHHAGLPDGGALRGSGNDGTLLMRNDRQIPDYGAYKNDGLSLSDGLAHYAELIKGWSNFERSVLTRMLFSALTDADWLDTEAFMKKGKVDRKTGAGADKFWPEFEKQIYGFLNPPEDAIQINKMRSKILNQCLSAAKRNDNLFSLTAPTGSGKTIASLAFALKRAQLKGHKRVIYVVPYNTIIEQNAKVIESYLGDENVLQHHSNIDYETDESDRNLKKKLATENWDYPVIVTSSVQFYESMFASSPSACRKLHNIVNSVIIFDEAQLIPQAYLKPCAAAIKALTQRFNCTAVLATATQMDLKDYMGEPYEMVENVEEVFNEFKRTKIEICETAFTNEDLCAKLGEMEQVLCIVNTRRRAQVLFSQLNEEGSFHLSTTMSPVDRSAKLEEIKSRLTKGLPCRVISTSLIEAGVDISFPKVFREIAGLDSVIQSAGRCNREGKLKYEQSTVTVFKFNDGAIPNSIKVGVSAFGNITKNRDNDLLSASVIKKYFALLFKQAGESRLDAKNILKDLEGSVNCLYPFKTISKEFKIIEDSSKTIYVLPDGELKTELEKGFRTRAMLRKLGQYGVSVYQKDYDRLKKEGKVFELDEQISLFPIEFYDNGVGVKLSYDADYWVA